MARRVPASFIPKVSFESAGGGGEEGPFIPPLHSCACEALTGRTIFYRSSTIKLISAIDLESTNERSRSSVTPQRRDITGA